MSRASRGLLELPPSCKEVAGWEGIMGCTVCPLESACDCELGWVEDAVGGDGFAAPEAVVGGVEIPFVISACAGEAMLRAMWELRRVGCIGGGAASGRRMRGLALRLCVRLARAKYSSEREREAALSDKFASQPLGLESIYAQ